MRAKRAIDSRGALRSFARQGSSGSGWQSSIVRSRPKCPFRYCICRRFGFWF